LAIVALLAVLPAPAQSGTIERIDVQGLFRMTAPAFLHAFGVQEGDPYDERQLRARFRALWEMGLFENIVIESETTPTGGKLVVVKVAERPVLTAVTYEDNKVVTTTQIEDTLKEREVELSLGKPIDPRRLADAEAVLRELLGSRGHLDSLVTYRVDEVTETSRAVTFSIVPGKKTRIRKIDFVNNTVYKDRVLKRTLQLTKPRKWYWPFSKKTLYHPLKWDQDVGNVRDLYLNAGYIDVDIRAPVVEVRESKKDAKKRKQQQRKAEKKGEPPAAATGDAPSTVLLASGTGGGEPEVIELPPFQTLQTAITRHETKLEKPDLSRKKRRKISKRLRMMRDKLEKKQKKALLKAQSGGRQWVWLTVPVSEGEQYRLGELTVNGNSVFTDEQVVGMVPLREGMILSNFLLENGIDRITRAYEDRGHLYASVLRRINRRTDEPAAEASADAADGDTLLASNRGANGDTGRAKTEAPIADVAIAVTEDEPYTIDRIDFTGNTTTHDRVLRRELHVSEGELFNRSRLDLSRVKLNQLGYWVSREEPLIEPIDVGPDAEDDNGVRIRFLGEEQGRNEIQVGGGYSGLDGAFFSGIYSTRNFLGRGQILSLSLQVGGRSDRYSISFTEPWFLNRPYTLGARLFRSDVDYGSTFRSRSDGLGLLLGKRIKRFGQFTIGYNYQNVESTSFSSVPVQTSQGFVNEVTAENSISSIVPTFQWTTINNPYRPSRGRSLTFATQIAGGPLGGDTSFVKPTVTFVGYKRAGRRSRSYFGMNVRLGYISDYDDGSPNNSANVNGVPRFERYWLGGDTLGPRIFETRTITPLRYVLLNDQGGIDKVLGSPEGVAVDDLLQSGGRPVLLQVGGDRFYLLQTEWVWPFSQQVEAALFFDAGDALFEDTDIGYETMRMSAGIEVRFHLPVFPVPLRLIWGKAIRELEEDDTSSFQFSIGRSF
jgi:outer membrane protein assembly factor BamA